eukprot:jgi/Tetstr1/457373/TSEL_043975.t1
MEPKAGYWLRNCLPSEVEAFAEAVHATVLAAVERVLRVSFDSSTYGTDTNPVVTDFVAELLHDPDPMAAEVATLSEDAMAMARSRLHLPTRLKEAGIRRMATVRDAILPRFVTRNSGTNTPIPGFFDPQLGAVLGRGSFNASSSARRHVHFLNDAHGSDSYAAEMREGEQILFNQLDAAFGMWTVAIPTARTVMTPDDELREVAAGYFLLPSPCLAPVVGSQIILPSTEHSSVTVDLYGDALMNLPAPGYAHWRVQHDAIADAFRCVHDLGIAVRREVDDFFQQAVPLGNTVPRDELEDLVPDAEPSLPAFNVVIGSYDPQSLKSTLLEFKTMRYGGNYTTVPRVTAVDRFERSQMGDIQRELAARDAAWHNTEPGQKGPLRDILDMSEYTGMVVGTVGTVSGQQPPPDRTGAPTTHPPIATGRGVFGRVAPTKPITQALPSLSREATKALNGGALECAAYLAGAVKEVARQQAEALKEEGRKNRERRREHHLRLLIMPDHLFKQLRLRLLIILEHRLRLLTMPSHLLVEFLLRLTVMQGIVLMV